MVDIHSHILPGLDDGAANLEEAISMLQAAASAGTTDIVATPHANLRHPFDSEAMEEAVGALRAVVGDLIRIHTGCELHLTVENAEDALAHPRKYAINHHCYVVLELPEPAVPKNTENILTRMLGVGIVPIIAHPERHPLLQNAIDRLAAWIDMGVLVQITAQSFSSRFGRRAKVSADKLVDRGLAHFVASDAHDTVCRPPALKKAGEYLTAKWGVDTAATLVEHNPKATLTGHPVRHSPLVRKKRWFCF